MLLRYRKVVDIEEVYNSAIGPVTAVAKKRI